MKKTERKSLIKVRGGFSDARGLANITNIFQINEFDERTRITLSNTLRVLLSDVFEGELRYHIFYNGANPSNEFSKKIISDVFVQPLQEERGMVYNWRVIFDNNICNVFLNAPYNEVLDMIWFICDWLVNNVQGLGNLPYEAMNNLFEKECVGYRFVGGRIVEMTDDNEIKEIEQAYNVPFAGCCSHINKAISFLADRENKDYKNCIKESISAVESICKIIANDTKSDLSKALKKLQDKGIHMPKALEGAWIKLYSYTSDEGGIRHAEKLFESDVTFEQAKYMLVSCSAFVNYLIAEYGKVKGNEK